MIGQRLGAYEIVAKLGEGGMGEVYRARDTRLDRDVAIKALPSQFASDPERLARFDREAKVLASLNHPNIAAIYGLEEVAGAEYLVLEYVAGESLADRLRRGALDVDEAVGIARQICDGLEAAHEKGIVHRDLKPANIMLTPRGHVKTLDFGLAKIATPVGQSADADITRTQTMTGAVMGTTPYMSPEQVLGRDMDHRTDLFSLGVVLYELTTGRLPFSGKTTIETFDRILHDPPASMAGSNAAVSPRFEQIVKKCLEKEAGQRFQSAKELGTALTSLSEAPHRALPVLRLLSRRRIAIAVSLVVAVLVVATWSMYFRSRAALSRSDTILIADFVNTTADATFDGGMLKQALAVQLRQTPFVHLFSDEGVVETLGYMGRPPTERITAAVGREICQRRGLTALLVGTIATLGRNYVITLEATSGRSGDVIASQQTEAQSKEGVLKALGDAAVGLRRQLGESLSTLQKYNAPIEQATTSSLQALNAYSQGLEQIYSGNYQQALPLFNRAVELDPDFAEAYVWLCWTHINIGDGQQVAFAEKAFSLRNRVTAFEQLIVDDLYYLWATGEWTKSQETDQQMIRLYPPHWAPYNSLAISYVQLGQHAQSLTAAREGIRINPTEVHLYWHLSNAHILLNQFEEARAAIREGQAHKLDHPWYRDNLFIAAFAQSDRAGMQEQLDAMKQKDGESRVAYWQARAAAFAGRRRDAQENFERTRFTNNKIESLVADASMGVCRSGKAESDLAFAPSRATTTLAFLKVPILPDGSLCGSAALAERLAQEQARRYPRALVVTKLSGPVLRAAIALQRNQPAEALDVLKPTLEMTGSRSAGVWPAYLRGQAQLRLSHGTEAAAEFQQVLDHRGWDPVSTLFPLARLGLARARAVSGDTTASRRAYEDFLSAWSQADPDLPILKQARQEFGRLK